MAELVQACATSRKVAVSISDEVTVIFSLLNLSDRTMALVLAQPPTEMNTSDFLFIFKYLGSILTNDGRCTCEIKSRIAMAKAAFNKKKILFTSKLDLKFEEETSKMLHLEHGFVWC